MDLVFRIELEERAKILVHCSKRDIFRPVEHKSSVKVRDRMYPMNTVMSIIITTSNYTNINTINLVDLMIFVAVTVHLTHPQSIISYCTTNIQHSFIIKAARAATPSPASPSASSASATFTAKLWQRGNTRATEYRG